MCETSGVLATWQLRETTFIYRIAYLRHIAVEYRYSKVVRRVVRIRRSK